MLHNEPMKQRLDQAMVVRGLVTSRSQAESYIKLGQVKVNSEIAKKPHRQVDDHDRIEVTVEEQYVSRAAFKLASVAELFKLDFSDKVVLDIGSSTGGFTQYALHHGAKKVYAIDVGTKQLHPSLRGDERIDLREQTDIRDVKDLQPKPDIVLADVSFISLREIVPTAIKLSHKETVLALMVKPQFEAGDALKHKGVIKNESMRRTILKEFEVWIKNYCVIIDKADSAVSGSKGNTERFYLLKKLS